jgi:hypothetical protein
MNYQDRMTGERLPKQIPQYKPKGHILRKISEKLEYLCEIRTGLVAYVMK